MRRQLQDSPDQGDPSTGSSLPRFGDGQAKDAVAPPPEERGAPTPARPSAINYELFNSSNVSIHCCSWNYRGCWHQTCPPVATRCSGWIAPIAEPDWGKIPGTGCHSSLLPRQCVSIGQFARLLPSLVVAAVSQAPSPESNPHSPSPVRANARHFHTIAG